MTKTNGIKPTQSKKLRPVLDKHGYELSKKVMRKLIQKEKGY